jgi:hypothetical protein
MQSEQQLVLASLNQQVSQTEQHISSLNAQIGSSGDPAQLKSLQAKRTQAGTTLYNLQQAVIGSQTVTQPATAAAVNGSVVLDPANLLAHSRFKPLAVTGAIGLVVGLALGVSIVMIQALVSDQLRRRDDVSQALGAQIKISVGPVRLSRLAPGRGGRAVTGNPDVLRVATHLGLAMPAAASGVASLVVVPVDDTRVPALCLVSLAVSSAAAGKRVVLADLCRGAPAAKLLGAGAPGIQLVSSYDVSLTVAVPDGDEVVPTGPLGIRPEQAGLSAFASELAAARDSADVLLTLVALDPSLGGDHLTTWAADAVVMVTAGRSSWTKIRGVSEMIRLSGVRLVSAVLVGVDKTDESLGLVPALETV